MKVVIIGPSGSGKTYFSGHLRKLGLNALDADSINGLSSWYDGSGNKVEFPNNAGADFLDNHSFLWNRDYLIKFLKESPDLYLFGLAGNIFDMVNLFDKVYFLKVPDQIIDERLQHGSRENSMGKTEYQREVVLKYAQEIEEKAKNSGIKFIDGTLSPEELLESIQ